MIAGLPDDDPPRRDERTSDMLRKREQRAKERDLVIPPPKNPDRRKRCLASAALFLKTYLPDKYTYAFTDDQLKIIAEVESALLAGRDKAIGAGRGGGKTSIIEGLLGVYFPFKGLLRFPLIIAKNGTAAIQILDNIKFEIERGGSLAEDFPEVCVPIMALDGWAGRSKMQTVNGQRTHIIWKGHNLRLPTVIVNWCPECLVEAKQGTCPRCRKSVTPWSPPSSGACFGAVGIDGSLRGTRIVNTRPDAALLDDIEDAETAHSPTAIKKNERIISKDVAGLAGIGKKLSRVMLCTPQNDYCIAARYINPQEVPAFSGVAFPQVITWPTAHATHWMRYVELRQDGKRTRVDEDGRAAVEYYLENREAMDAGAVVSNPHDVPPTTAKDGFPLLYSAIQKVYDFWADNGEAATYSEYQLQPKPAAEESGIPRAADLRTRISDRPRWHARADTIGVYAHIDMGKDVFWWTVIAVNARGGGEVIAYGTWPQQQRAYVLSSEVSPTYTEWHRNHFGREAAQKVVVYETLEYFSETLFEQEVRVGDSIRSIDKIGVDSGWMTDVVYRLCQTPAHSWLIPTKGEGVRVTGKPISARPKRSGEIRGDECRYVEPENQKVRVLEFDTNYWKWRVHEALVVPPSADDAIVLYGQTGQDHAMYADHLVAEYRVEVQAKGRQGYEYFEKPTRDDNHLLDTTVGAVVVANLSNAHIRRRPRRKLSEIRNRLRGVS